ncbi:hypothetical protein [Luteibacter yeojuensis]|uniref:Uncharacterized protein n=1 Tax=Luteibacter yeojuensis TaxID=345309 RepID=A0A7X5QSH6_9GAMM|nr:hypothetical protein [Luteibacter yeojuensis]NID14534.1 hypothetical protein [Luteibacter yeojuensis]
MQKDLEPLRPHRTKDVYPAPRYAFDSFDHGINRRTIAQEPYHAVFYAGPFAETQRGDTLVLFFGDDGVPIAQVPLPDGPTGEIEILAPADQLLRYVPDNQIGRVDIWYAVVRPLEAIESVRLSNYLIDFQPPGGIPVFGDPSYVNTNLGRIPELENDIPQGQPLRMNVPPWENMSIGDKLFVRWGSRSLGPFEITTEGQRGRPVEVTVPWEVISETDGGVARVDYYITDNVNNHSYYAAARVVDAGRPLLPRPILPEHLDGVIDLDLLRDRDVYVLIAFSGMVRTDSITLIAERINDDGITLPPYSLTVQGNDTESVRVDIPNALVKDISTGQMRLRYEVARQPLLRSGVTTALVKGGDATLAPVNTPEFPNFQVDVAQLHPSGLLVQIPRYAFLADSDRITVTSTFTRAGTTYTDTQVRFGSDFAGAGVLSIRVPTSKIVPAAGGTGSIVYTVQPNAQPAISAPARGLVIVGTVPGDWDLEYNFDNDRLRHVNPGRTIVFPETGTQVMNMYFDPDRFHPTAEELGVEKYPFQPETVDFRGNTFYVGNPTGITHSNTFFVNFAQSWDVVRFAVTSVHRTVTVSFKDANLNVISPIFSIGGPAEKQSEVIFNDQGRRRIRHLEIRTVDVVRFDSFKFKR